MLQLLLQTFLFNGIPEDAVKDIAAFSELVSFLANEEVNVENDHDPHPDIFLLVVGSASVETRFSSLPNAESMDLHPIDTPIFGEVAWLLGGKRTAVVSCTDKCKFIRINGKKLHTYCQEHPEIGVTLTLRIARVLAKRVSHLTDLVREKALYS